MKQEFFDYRRAHKRLPCLWPGEIATIDRGSHEIRCIDISQQGIGFSSPLPLRINSHAKLKVETDKMGQLVLEGKVCWCRKAKIGWEVGMTFTKSLPHPLERLI